MACCSIWLVATIWSSFPLFGWGEYVPEPYGLSCTIAWRGYHTSKKDAFYVICSFLCFALVPVLFIVVSQCLILYKVCRFGYSLSAKGIHINLRQTEKQLSVMFFCISLGFVIAWAPYSIVSFLFIFNKGDRYMAPEGFVFPALFAKSSHVYNPLIYFYFNKTFQEELRCLLLSFWPKMGGNRVGVQVASHNQAPYPIHIQLQERRCIKKTSLALSRERTHTNNKSKNKSRSSATKHTSYRFHSRKVYACWGSSPKNVVTFMGSKSAKHSIPVSI